VRAGVVVVALELGQVRAQVRLVHDDQPVEALSPQRPHEPLGNRARLRRPDGREERFDAEVSRPPDGVATVDRIPVPHQVPRRAPPRGGRDQLAPDPSGGRVRRDVQVDELAPGVLDEDEHVQPPERERLHGQ